MEKIELIAMDMDGTLLTSHQKILPYTKEVLMNLQKQGVSLVLASGRDIESLAFYGKQLEIEKYPQSGYIVLNGLEIYNSQKECLYKGKRLNKDDVYILNALAKKYMFDMVIFFEKCLYILTYGKTGIMENHFIDRDKYGIDDVNKIPDDLYQSVKKVAFIQSATVMDKVLPIIQLDMKSRFEICRVERDWVEVNPAMASKGKALMELSTIKNIPLSHMIAFGNGENDIEMLKVAGKGVAMENSFATVKSAGNDVCLDNEHDGIGVYLENLKV